MKILILSCNTGEGHNSAGKALAEYARFHGDSAEFMDIMMLGGKRISRFVGGGYVSVVKYAPGFFSFLYKLGGLVSSSRHKSPVYYANALLAGRLKRYLEWRSRRTTPASPSGRRPNAIITSCPTHR